MGIFHPTLLCQIYPQVCSSDTADTIAEEIAEERRSFGGLADSGWATPSWGESGTLSPHLCFHSKSTSRGLFSQFFEYRTMYIIAHKYRFVPCAVTACTENILKYEWMIMPRTCPAFPSQPLCSTTLHNSNKGTSKQGNRWRGMGACSQEGSSTKSRIPQTDLDLPPSWYQLGGTGAQLAWNL
eukprot:1139845-Pelagomonas_calceolata.AAC.3